MDILDIGMRDVTLRPYFTEIFFENGETREFMDRLLLECRLDKGLTNNLSHRSRNLLLKIFDESKFLRRDLLDTLNIEKLLLLDISARIQNHDGIITKLHSEALATGKQIEVYMVDFRSSVPGKLDQVFRILRSSEETTKMPINQYEFPQSAL